MLTRNIRTALLTLALVSSACSSSGESPVTEAPRESNESALDNKPICDPSDVPPEPNDRLIQLVEPGVSALPGSTIRFEWPADALPESLTGDELFVECWTGAGWEQLYAGFGIFSSSPRVVEFEEGVDMEFTSDGFVERVGAVPIPDWAKPGSYRFLTERAIAVEGLFTKGEGRFTIEE